MFTTGYSAKMAEEDEQGVSTFENFAERDFFPVNGLKGEVGGGGICFEFQGSGSKYQVKLRFAQMRR
jgi:hypothetical protein